MRKVLLASTALVAMSSASAMAADVTISGSAEFQYESYSTNTAFTGGGNGTSTDFDQDVNIKFSTVTDTGLTLSMDMGLNEGGGQDDQSLTIAGDFGSLKFESGDDGAAGAMDVDSDLVADSAQTILGASGDGTFVGKGSASVTGDSITYTLPSIAPGLSIAGSYSDAGTATKSDATELALKYVSTMEGATVTFAAQQGNVDDNGTADSGKSKSHYGVSIAMGALTIAAEANTIDLDSSNNDYEGSSIGVSYAVNDALTIAATSSSRDKKGTVTEASQTAASATYTVAPGLSVSLTVTDTEEGAGASKSTEDYSVLAINASF